MMVPPFIRTFKYIFMCLFVTFLLACSISLFLIPPRSTAKKIKILEDVHLYEDENVQTFDAEESTVVEFKAPEELPIQVEEKSDLGGKEDCRCPSGQTLTPTFENSHLLGVVVPFRDRFEELLEFAPHIVKFLAAQKINHKIYIINQVDQYRFNRASLINVGFKLAVSEGCDYIAMHDVDLLPLNPTLSYHYPTTSLCHVASPEYHPRYHYNNFVGGILIIKKEDFIRVNGMSNKYWGWGLEDDEFFIRLKEAGLHVSRPTNLTTGIENTFRHIHDRVWRKRDMAKCFNQKEVTRHRDRLTGLRDVVYIIRSKHQLSVDSATVTIVNTELRCNRTVTPWCLCSAEKKKETSNRQGNGR